MNKYLKRALDYWEPKMNANPTEYGLRQIKTVNSKGEVVFQADIVAPTHWSDLAVTICADKYMKVVNGVQETNVVQVLGRVAQQLVEQSVLQGLLTDKEAPLYGKVLLWLQEQQYFAFNSPVYFNLGVKNNPQTSACFIGEIRDDMGQINPDGTIDIHSISGQQYVRNSVFKGGSGYGANWSYLRAAGEPLSHGGTSSGVMSFIKASNAYSGVLKSGGTCLTEATPLFIESGFQKVVDLVGEQFTILSRDVQTSLVTPKRATAFKSGRKECVRVTTNKGIFEVSFDHPFLTQMKEYVCAQDLMLKNLSCYTCTKQDFQMEPKSKNDIEELLESSHTVIWVESIGERDVYDVQVECDSPEDRSQFDNHNFAIGTLGCEGQSQGVVTFVHNTRRAAEMVILDVDHPEIEVFIGCKIREEEKMQDLLATGKWGDPFDMDNEAQATVHFQNMNLSINITDEFMIAVENDYDWQTKGRIDKNFGDICRAKDLFNKFCYASWRCGDPAPKFHDTTNRWNTCAADFEIRACNPCGEYVFCDDSSCNLASIRLTKFINRDGSSPRFDHDVFIQAISVILFSMDMLIDFSSFPTPQIAYNTRLYRALGLGYCDLGGLLLEFGLPYASEEACSLASNISHTLTLQSYRVSHETFKNLQKLISDKDLEERRHGLRGGHPSHTEYLEARKRNKASMSRVLQQHKEAAERLNSDWYSPDVQGTWWDELIDHADEIHNMQVTLLAPTGTISFMLDASTTGIEPEMFLWKTKRFVGGQLSTYVGESTKKGLEYLGYDIEEILKSQTIEWKEDHHKEIFKTSYGDNALSPDDHLKIMVAVQPFLSGAISKTIGLPEGTSPDGVGDLYFKAWKLGLKSLTIYVDGSKSNQPLSDGSKKEEDKGSPPESTKLITTQVANDSINSILEFLGKTRPELATLLLDVFNQQRSKFKRKLPADRDGICHKFKVGAISGYLHINYDPISAKVCEIFVDLAKANSTLKGFMDAWCILFSMALRNGISLKELTDKFSYTRFEPDGFTGNPKVPRATSIIDYIVRILDLNHNDNIASYYAQHGYNQVSEPVAAPIPEDAASTEFGDYGGETGIALVSVEESGALSENLCNNCNSMMIRTGTCHTCPTCGNTDGPCG